MFRDSLLTTPYIFCILWWFENILLFSALCQVVTGQCTYRLNRNQLETLRSLEYLVPGWMLNEEQCGNLSSELLFHRSGVSYCTLESYCKDLIIFSSTSSLQGNCIMCVPSRINIVRGPYMHNMQEYAITNVTTCSRSKDLSPSQDDFCDLWYGRPHGLRTSLCGLTPSSPISVQC